MLPFLPHPEQCVICVEPDRSFRSLSSRPSRQRWLSRAKQFLKSLGLTVLSAQHAHFGGSTSAIHACGFGSNVVGQKGFPLVQPNVRRGLVHFLSAAVDGFFRGHSPPPPLDDSAFLSQVLYADEEFSLVRREGLLPCYRPDVQVLCPSVFGPATTKKYITRQITIREALCIYSIPSMYHDDLLRVLTHLNDPLPFESSVSPDILTSFVTQLWGMGVHEGGDGGSDVVVSKQSEGTVPIETVSMDTPSTRERDGSKCIEMITLREEESRRSDDDESEDNKYEEDKDLNEEDEAGASTQHHEYSEEVPVAVKLTEEKPMLEVDDELLAAKIAQERIKIEKEKGKAAKADDASVPVHHWNNRILENVELRDGVTPSEIDRAVDVLREWGLKRFWRRLRKACTDRLRANFGDTWTSQPRVEDGRATDLAVEIAALAKIVWHSTEADWFEYKSGSTLHYFRFPLLYQGIAKDGVPVFFEKNGPRSKRKQPPMTDEDMKKTVAEKVAKVIKRGYMFSSGIRLLSLIKYFAVPKTDTDYRLVYDATANGLNEAVWAPSFWLPTVDTLVRYVDENTWMMDRDIGDMFLNFPLDKKVWPYTGLHLGDLFDEDTAEGAAILEKAGGKWVHWGRCLMGFKPSPYNAIKTSLVVEEVVKGDRHCDSNPFQWDHVRLNLPGDEDYNPRISWISKMRKDGLIACDLFTFVDDERCAGPTRELAWAAGHRLACIQAYLGIQDAARKVRPCSKTCGAWAGAVVHVTPDKGVCVLTSEEKWKKFKDILAKWLERLERGDTKLDHKELRSDRGFCVYLTRNYPSMIPYLKGFHLSLEMWRGGRDKEGWKLPSRARDRRPDVEDDLIFVFPIEI